MDNVLIDNLNRKIDYIRVSVTDRCPLRCVYCMPAYGILQKSHNEILSYEEITSILKIALGLGINKIRITGGEPLVRKDIIQFLQKISSLPELKDLSLTTNGIFLKKYINGLKDTRIKRINVSLDSLDAQKFGLITRFGELKDVLSGIDTAIEEGFLVKLNTVLMKGLNDNEVFDFIRYAERKKIIIRFIELMPTQDNTRFTEDLYISFDEIKDRLQAKGSISEVNLNIGNGPARYYKIEGVSTVIGFINPLSHKFCFNCNRLRLTSDGFLLPCLCSQTGFDLLTPLRKDRQAEVLNLIKEAVFLKPAEHNFSSGRQYLMSQIGG